MTTLSHATPSRYTLHHTLADLGFPPLRIALAVEVLLGPEPDEDVPFGPSAEDWEEYARFAAWQNALEAAHPPVREEDVRAAGLAI